MNFEEIKNLLGSDKDALLNYTYTGIPNKMIHPLGLDFIERVREHLDRNNLIK